MLDLVLRIETPLSGGHAQRVADLILRRAGLAAGADARDVVLGLGLRVCPRRGGVAEVVGGRVLYYNWWLYRTERDQEIYTALTWHLLGGATKANPRNVEAITLALSKKASGLFRSVG